MEAQVEQDRRMAEFHAKMVRNILSCYLNLFRVDYDNIYLCNFQSTLILGAEEGRRWSQKTKITKDTWTKDEESCQKRGTQELGEYFEN